MSDAGAPGAAPIRRGPVPALTRRGLVRGAAALAAAVAGGGALGGCGTSWGQGFTGGQGPADRIDYWNPFSGGDGQRMTEMVTSYARAHRGLDIRAVTLTWGNPYYTKLSLAALGGGAPEVAICHLSRLPTLARSGLLRALPADLVGPYGITGAAFDARPWRKAHADGRLWGVPLDTHPFVMYFRSDLCRKAGLLDGDGRLVSVAGPDRLVEVLRELKKVTGQWGASVAVTTDPSTCWRLFWSLYCQLDPRPAGRALLADGGRKVVMDGDRAGEVLAFLRRLTVTERVLPRGIDPSGAMALFTSGRSGVLFDGVWQLPTIQAGSVTFDMRPFPRVFDEAPYACHADSHALVLPSSPGARPRREEVALRFVRGLLEESLEWAKGGHIPAWLATQRSPGYRRLVPQVHYAAAADGAVYDPDAWYSGAGSNLETLLGGVVAGVLGGRTGASSGVAQLRAHLKDLAATSAPV
jgi:multiple sugar transport system substrate-binding protein